MAVSLVVEDVGSDLERHEALIAEYRERLSRPAEVGRYTWEPVVIGPTWQVGEDGRYVLPERTIGWDVLAWCGTWLQHGRDEPWRFTPEQARFVLHWYSLDERGAFVYHDFTFQRLKGHGKDPIAACLMAVELLGPCRFDGWDERGQPVARDVAEAWVQTAAVSLEQTKNTMRLFPGLFTPEAKARFGLQIGKEKIYALGDERMIEAVTSSPATLEGARATFIVLNEPHHWLEANDGHEMAAVIARNAAKSPDGGARTGRITNAYEPGEDSVAERDRDAYDKMAAGKTLFTGYLYDSLEAGAEAPLSAEAAPDVVRSIRGDSTWLNPERIVQEILDPRNPPSRSRRFWYNQIVAAEDAWTTPQDWDANADPDLALAPGEPIVMFFDGSKTDDATGLVACRISDGVVFTLGVWQRPDLVEEWSVPRDDVDAMVARACSLYEVRAFFADPGGGKDEHAGDGERYWDAYIDRWGSEHGDQLDLWATEGGKERHAVMWDMSSPLRQRLFTEAAGRVLADIEAREMLHDGHPVLRTHVVNARRRPNQWGVTVTKEHRESRRKIDLAVCAIGARMVRRMWLALPERKRRRRKTGRVVIVP